MLSIGNLTASPGQKVSGNVPIQRSPSATGGATNSSNNATTPPTTAQGESENNSISLFIPMTIVRGLNDGPTLVVLSGVHGSEYVPIRATQKLARELDPSAIRGTLVLVHIVNLPAYLGRTVYTSPNDGKNLNRVFPGSADGSPTERIADFLVNEIYPLADGLLDMHSGDANEQLGPSYTAYYGKAGSEDIIQKSKDMAFSFGLGLVVEFQWELQGNSSKVSTFSGAIWAGSAAVVRGIPSIDVEVAPGMGAAPSGSINDVYQGVQNVMGHLGMFLEENATTSNDTVEDDHPCLVTNRRFIDAPTEGSWVALVNTGSFVKEGTLLGTITDFSGRNTIFEAKAPCDGLLLIRFETPPVLAGDTVAVIAVLDGDSCDQLRSGGQFRLDPSKVGALVLWQWSAAIGWLVALGLSIIFRRSRRNGLYREQPAHQAVPVEDGSMT
ncbi:unnamed protein product [Pseudo-nitzschia multistriata]|uniref:Succinylglutamate desuccinylase/Aspartoacylase catalytic domain-containing protein n=1 Tax=Pseudo-nitzschia multistriata TaxID=183589 RepID=A0A448ZBC7_9STRA|nr:unnamed protein product [Pseudo-nitzschia multistriata]